MSGSRRAKGRSGVSGGHSLAKGMSAFVVGVALLIWVAVEIAIIGYSNEPPLQAVYLTLGVAITLGAVGWATGRRPRASPPAGPPTRSDLDYRPVAGPPSLELTSVALSPSTPRDDSGDGAMGVGDHTDRSVP